MIISAPGQKMVYALVNMKSEQIVDIVTIDTEKQQYPARAAKERFGKIRTPDDRIFLMLGGEPEL